ncbi:DUF4232 domain-containing protein [Streptomyces sp. NPDC096205]|uniref:DUF4232 domain-containing protein n=1 Tax=Streptomyces sp. NPDC096205 TaxID=3366081 RepID=UPI00382B779C
MRALRITVTALAASLVLTACDSEGGDTDSKPRAGEPCAIGSVRIAVGPANVAPAAGDTGNVPVTVTNPGPECTLKGFPEVVLDTGHHSVEVPADKAAKAGELTLAEGTAASFTLTYVRGAEGDGSLAVRTLRIALPGSSEQRDFDWSNYGPVAGTDTPQASFTAFQQAGD